MSQTVLITGATGGLGLRAALAVAAAEQGWHLVVTGRGPGLEEVGRRLGERAPCTALPLDLAELAGVHRFADDLTRRLADGELPPLRAVVANAGLQETGLSFTPDGLETTFAVNHLAHFLLVNRLLPSLVEPARIVLVASDTHDPARMTGMPAPRLADPDTLARPADTEEERTPAAGRRRYTTSKLCNVLTAYELARRLEGTEITVNAFDPGLMPGTGLARRYRGVQAFAWRYLMPALIAVPGLNAHTPARSGAALARLVTDPALAGVTGAYFSNGRRTRSSEESYDTAKAAELWEGSERLLTPGGRRPGDEARRR